MIRKNGQWRSLNSRPKAHHESDLFGNFSCLLLKASGMMTVHRDYGVEINIGSYFINDRSATMRQKLLPVKIDTLQTAAWRCSTRSWLGLGQHERILKSLQNLDQARARCFSVTIWIFPGVDLLSISNIESKTWQRLASVVLVRIKIGDTISWRYEVGVAYVCHLYDGSRKRWSAVEDCKRLLSRLQRDMYWFRSMRRKTTCNVQLPFPFLCTNHFLPHTIERGTATLIVFYSRSSQ